MTPLFSVCRTEMLDILFFYDLGTGALVSDVYLSLPDVDFIVKSNMAVISHIFN